MYTNGIGVAIVIGIMALVLPAVWIGWWLVADLGEKVGGSAREAPIGRFHPVI